MKRLETKWQLEGRTSAGGPVISIRCLMHANNRHHSFFIFTRKSVTGEATTSKYESCPQTHLPCNSQRTLPVGTNMDSLVLWQHIHSFIYDSSKV